MLSICDDEGLGLSRRLLLENAGYEVESVDSNFGLSPSELRSFDVAVICQSVRREAAVKLTERLRRCHFRIRILRVNLQPMEPDGRFDGACDSMNGPQLFLDAVGKLLKGVRKNSASAPPIAI